MAAIIDLVRRIGSRLTQVRPVRGSVANQCAAGADPLPAIESLVIVGQWSTGADLADAYRSACPGVV